MEEKPALQAREARLPRPSARGLADFHLDPRQGGLTDVTFYPDPNHTWDGGTQ
jgi:hypothetical protein